MFFLNNATLANNRTFGQNSRFCQNNRKFGQIYVSILVKNQNPLKIEIVSNFWTKINFFWSNLGEKILSKTFYSIVEFKFNN